MGFFGDIFDLGVDIVKTTVQVGVQVGANVSAVVAPSKVEGVVRRVVEKATLDVNYVLITNPAENSFEANLRGSIALNVPVVNKFDAVIFFGSEINIEWYDQGSKLFKLGQIKMPTIKITGGEEGGGPFEVNDTFKITNVGHMTNFMEALLTRESIDLEFSGENLTVRVPYFALDVPGISLPGKRVTLKGFNNLKDGVSIKSLNLPDDHPDGGIRLKLDATISNPSQIGIYLSNIDFRAYLKNTYIGPVTSNGSFKLEPWGNLSLCLFGRLIPQTLEPGLLDVSNFINDFICGRNSNVSVHGDSAGLGGATWLNKGIKSFHVKAVLQNKEKLRIIESIGLNELDFQFTQGTAYNPTTSSNDATVAFKLPPGFNLPVDIKALRADINVSASAGGVPFAKLIIPDRPASTNMRQRIVRFTFSAVSFAVLDGQQDAFQQFLASVTTSANQTMHLSGNANVDAHTAVGLLPLAVIDFSVSTSIAGMQRLSAKPPLVTIPHYRGVPDHLSIKVVLSNPSNITLGAGKVKFDLFFQNQKIGTADLTNLLLLPGDQSYTIGVHFQGDAVSDGRVSKLLENYRQGATLEIMIRGSEDSTTIASLKTAFSKIRLTPRPDTRA